MTATQAILMNFPFEKPYYDFNLNLRVLTSTSSWSVLWQLLKLLLLKKPNFVCQYFVVLTQDAFMIRIRMFTVQSQELWIWLGLRICIHRYWSCNASPWTKLTHNWPSKISWVINADDSNWKICAAYVFQNWANNYLMLRILFASYHRDWSLAFEV